MNRTTAAFVGALSFAALGYWIAARRQAELFASASDDDAQAEIIRRARPSLELAYQLEFGNMAREV